LKEEEASNSNNLATKFNRAMMRMTVLPLVARDFGDSQGFFINIQIRKQRGSKTNKIKNKYFLHRLNGNKPEIQGRLRRDRGCKKINY